LLCIKTLHFINQVLGTYIGITYPCSGSVRFFQCCGAETICIGSSSGSDFQKFRLRLQLCRYLFAQLLNKKEIYHDFYARISTLFTCLILFNMNYDLKYFISLIRSLNIIFRFQLRPKVSAPCGSSSGSATLDFLRIRILSLSQRLLTR
jgi:hypothetical protein